jgi:hypothetical protein
VLALVVAIRSTERHHGLEFWSSPAVGVSFIHHLHHQVKPMLPEHLHTRLQPLQLVVVDATTPPEVVVHVKPLREQLPRPWRVSSL